MMTVGRVAANYPAWGGKRDERQGKVEEAYVFVGLFFGPFHLQGMGVRDFLALQEQVRAQRDSILGMQCEVLIH